MLVATVPVLQAAEDVLQSNPRFEALFELLGELANDPPGRLAVAVDVGADDLLRCHG